MKPCLTEYCLYARMRNTAIATTAFFLALGVLTFLQKNWLGFIPVVLGLVSAGFIWHAVYLERIFVPDSEFTPEARKRRAQRKGKQ